ncbi:MAG: PAQR family membrane homeostasis protein TrhA [Gemmatimonadaceae bacterium]
MPRSARRATQRRTPARLVSTGEEIANSITHGAGLVASIVALPVLVVAAVADDDRWQVVGNAIFGATLILLYASSTLYHALPRQSAAKRVFRVIDHSAIYLLIAGTYTPFALGALRGPWGWSLLGTTWGLASVGIALKTIRGFGRQWLSTTVYLLMGWLALVAIHPLLTHVGLRGLAWMAAGGLCYTAGVAFFAWDRRLRYSHLVWHLFVIAGSVCHFFAVLWHADGTGAGG